MLKIEYDNRGLNHALMCPNCGSTNTAVGPGVGPHHAKLICGDCGAWRWLPKPKVKTLWAAEGERPPLPKRE